MKAQRRHQLKNNALAAQLETFPEKLKKHASSIMLAITSVIVVIFLMRYRNTAAQNRQTGLASSVNVARIGPAALREMDLQPYPDDQVALRRTALIAETNSAIETILRDAEGDNAAAYRAQALLAKGDLNWSLANLAPLKSATTQPSMKLPRSEDEYLKAAEDAYRDIVNAYSAQKIPWVAAQFGLGAIAENRGDFAAARTAYGALLSAPSTPAAFQQSARLKLAMLPRLEIPALLRSYPATAPTTGPTTGPTTAPTTQPDVPASTPGE